MKRLNDTVVVIFATNNKPKSLIVKLFTLSQWSHVAILDDMGYVIDSTPKYGVRRIHFDEWKINYSKLDFTAFPTRDRKKVFAFLEGQVGKEYDALGVFSFILRRDYEDKNKWFCSEIVATAVGIKCTPWKLSPQFLFRFYKTMKGYIL